MTGLSVRGSLWVAGLAMVALGCGAGSSTVGGGGGGGSAGDAGSGGGGGTSGCISTGAEICGDALDNDCNGLIDDGFDKDSDGYKLCESDCNDNDSKVYPGAVELSNGVDDNCDGKIDNRIAGLDYDQDGTPHPQDCDDDEPLVGPRAIEVAGDSVDNNCNGTVDEAVAANCDAQVTGATATDFAKAIGICPSAADASSLTASFMVGNTAARKIRTKFGTQWSPKQGANMAMLSTGKAVDLLDDSSYRPQRGHDFYASTNTHPLYSTPKCAAPTSPPDAEDMTEFKVSMKVPQNAKSFSYQFNFFSAEYPEFVCTEYNDRFIAILESKGLDKTKLPGGGVGQCLTGAGTARCNISYDSSGQPVTVNNGFFDVCMPASGSGPPAWSNACTKPVSLLDKTGYELTDPLVSTRLIGGATGWLTTKAPVMPGEIITLRFIVLDEGDAVYDSAVLIDNFKWEATAVTAPATEPGIN